MIHWKPLFIKTETIYKLSEDTKVAIARVAWMLRWLFINIHFAKSTGLVYSLERKLTDDEARKYKIEYESNKDFAVAYSIDTFEPYLMKLSSNITPRKYWFGENTKPNFKIKE